MTVREGARRLVRSGEVQATPNQEPLGAPATVSPASAAEHEQDDENDQQGFHVFLFGEEKQGDRLLECTHALSLLVVHILAEQAMSSLFTSEQPRVLSRSNTRSAGARSTLAVDVRRDD